MTVHLDDIHGEWAAEDAYLAEMEISWDVHAELGQADHEYSEVRAIVELAGSARRFRRDKAVASRRAALASALGAATWFEEHVEADEDGAASCGWEEWPDYNGWGARYPHVAELADATRAALSALAQDLREALASKVSEPDSSPVPASTDLSLCSHVSSVAASPHKTTGPPCRSAASQERALTGWATT